MSLIFVDVEAFGPCPSLGQITELGAVCYDDLSQFYAKFVDFDWPSGTPQPQPLGFISREDEVKIYTDFDNWLKKHSGSHPVFVSDNPAYDWQWVNDGFHRTLNRNPFGFSARRIGDFYAGLCGSFWKSNQWKKLRRTEHTHNPVDDALGNLEAFQALLRGDR